MTTFRKGSIIGEIAEGGNIKLSAAYDKPGKPTGLIRGDSLPEVIIERADVDDVIAVLTTLKGKR